MYTGSQPFSCPQSIVLFQLLFLLTLLFGSILSFPSLLMSLRAQIHRFLHFRVHRVLRKKILPIIHYSFVFQLKLQTIISKAVSLLRPPIHSNYLQFFFSFAPLPPTMPLTKYIWLPHCIRPSSIITLGIILLL